MAVRLRWILAALLAVAAPDARAADPFQDKVRPFIEAYCTGCHNEKKSRGDLDLTRFTTAAKAADDFRQWEHVQTFLKKGEMPPAKHPKQPSARERTEALQAIAEVMRTEAARRDGDPGIVPPRRLTNAEYDYTIRDITGADIHPARAFPVDPASGEGFNNTGEALTMSPSLFKKYYAAAEQVADHALLTTAGLRFAPHPVVAFADRQKYYEQAIIKFYEAHDVDYEKYLTSLWMYQHRPAEKKTITVEAWAKQAGLSPKYARSLWDALAQDTEDRHLMRWLRQRWAAFPAPKSPAAPQPSEVQAAARNLASDIRQLSRELGPVEPRLIIPDAGNGPIEHLARRDQVAEARGTADPRAATNNRFPWEFRNITDRPTFKLVIEIADLASGIGGRNVVVVGSFSTNNPVIGSKKQWTLREVLEKYAPEEAKKLKFGVHPGGEKLPADFFTLTTPARVELTLPSAAFPFKNRGSVTFTALARLAPDETGAVLVRVSERKTVSGDGRDLARPLVPPLESAKFDASAAAFCKLFPNRFVYVDSTRGLSAGFHLIEGFFRDDRPLYRNVLSDAEKRELDGLWRELYFVTGIWEKMLRGFVFFERSERNFLKHRDFDSFKEEDPDLVKDETLIRFRDVYLKRAGVKATGADLATHPISRFFNDVRAGLRGQAETLARCQPLYLRDLLAFAERAYRRPLTENERQKLEAFYAAVCKDKDHGVEAAVRASLVRILVSPHFCMRFDAAPAGGSAALPDLALASRLSYFLWSGPPDRELLALAKAGKLRDETVLRGQVRRMIRDPKVSRFALEFFGQWLGYRDFLKQESVNRQVFPAFDDALKNAMFEEPTRLIADLIETDRPITELLSGDATFVNKRLAQHYGLPFTGKADEWVRIEGLHEKGRGGILGMAVILTKNSQPQRTSPVKRGFWVVHKLLGEHIPPPPPDVAVLPAKETDTHDKTIRQLMKLHVEDPKCASCHQRFDSIGLAMEGFDPIGRLRLKDLAGRPVDNVVALPSGKETRGIPEFGEYLAANRKAEFTLTLCQKFLGYALGRSLLLSDQPLLERMEAELNRTGKLSAIFELAVLSPQFRNKRE